MIARDNRKSASSAENKEILLSNYTKEVDQGWMLPVTLESVRKIKGAGVIPSEWHAVLNQRERQQKN